MTQQSYSWAYIWRQTWFEKTCISMFIAGLFTIDKTRKQPKCPSTDKWIKKMWCMCVCVCIYMNISHTKE